jgi:hypothetical protein
MRILREVVQEIISVAIGLVLGGLWSYLDMNPEQYIAPAIGNPPDWLNINFLIITTGQYHALCSLAFLRLPDQRTPFLAVLNMPSMRHASHVTSLRSSN